VPVGWWDVVLLLRLAVLVLSVRVSAVLVLPLLSVFAASVLSLLPLPKVRGRARVLPVRRKWRWGVPLRVWRVVGGVVGHCKAVTSPLTPPSLAVARPRMCALPVPPPPRVKMTRVLGMLAALVRRLLPLVVVVLGMLLLRRGVVTSPAVARRVSAFRLRARPPTTTALPPTPARGGRWLVGAADAALGVAGGVSRRARRAASAAPTPPVLQRVADCSGEQEGDDDGKRGQGDKIYQDKPHKEAVKMVEGLVPRVGKFYSLNNFGAAPRHVDARGGWLAAVAGGARREAVAGGATRDEGERAEELSGALGALVLLHRGGQGKRQARSVATTRAVPTMGLRGPGSEGRSNTERTRHG